MSKNYADIPLFAHMSARDIRSVLQCVGAFTREYKKDEFIYLEEDRIDCVGCVIKGSVQIIHENIWGDKAMLLAIGEKELFGESFCCDGSGITAVSFTAKEATTVLFLPFDRVVHTCPGACAYHHQLVMNMITVMAQKNAGLMAKIDILSKKTLREKIAAYLMNAASSHNAKYFTVPMGRIELAEYLNADRSALTRELNAMKEEGFIDFEKNTFRILKEFS